MYWRPLLLSLIVILFLSCSRQRDLVYFSDLNQLEQPAMVASSESPTILENDLLSISVNSISPESNVLFVSSSGNQNINGTYEKEGYKVTGEGNIKFPVIGLIKLRGLTTSEAQALIEQKLAPIVKNAVVNVNFMNFRVTVIGEVNHPSTFVITNEKINILEALGMAGDMTPYGRRENVLLIREADGKRKMLRLNLNRKDILTSPYFYLKQNDVVYVEPDKAKSKEYSNSNRLMPLVVAAISAVAVMATTLIK